MKQPSKLVIANRCINQALGYIIKSLIFLCFANVPVQAQSNVVVNGDFEVYSLCPDAANELNYASGWDTLRAGGGGTPEYLNKCSSTPGYGVPSNFGGYMQAHSGKGYCTFMCYVDYNTWIQRDYVQGTLAKKLVSGKQYCVSFYISLAEGFSEYAIDEFGAYLDDGSIKTSHYGVANIVPQVKSPRIGTEAGGKYLTDTANWMRVQGLYVSDGTEQYITLGNFRDLDSTHAIKAGNCSFCDNSYYYLDDVSVIEINTKAQAGNDTTITKGDSAFVGVHDIGDTYTWYANGTAFYTGSEAGLYVTPTVNTTYIVKQTVCSVITYDTCVVTVNPVGINQLKVDNGQLTISPNPVSNGELRIENGEWVTDIEIYDLLGVYQPIPRRRGQGVNVSTLAKGIYMLHLQGTKGSVVRKIVIE